jgi:hypothetical protein
MLAALTGGGCHNVSTADNVEDVAPIRAPAFGSPGDAGVSAPPTAR